MYNSIYPNINYHRQNLSQSASSNFVANKNQKPQSPTEQSSNNQQQQTFPNGTKVAIDYSKGQINISQVLMDFRNTIVAINAPDDVKDEVNLYLNLVDRESRKDSPNRDIVLANLKNASKISDNYIANSLNKPSNVVEGWIDALFLQKINLKADPEEINPDFLLEFPKKTQEKIDIQNETEKSLPKEEEKVDLAQIQQEAENQLIEEKEVPQEENKTQVTYQNIEVESSLDISEENESQAKDAVAVGFSPVSLADTKAKEIFSQAKQLPQTESGYTDAVNLLNEALGIMENNSAVNENIKAAIHLERGKIFDKYDYVDYALRDYFEATKANDLNLKANAFYKTGKIYDEFSEFSPALNNYLSSVAYSGEADNYTGQATVLSKIADLYARQYDIERFDDYSSLALDTAQTTHDEDLIAKTYSNNAQNYQYLGDNDRALDNYKNALEIFSRNDESYEQMAYNYEQAANVMDKLGNSLKAAKLQQKALRYYELAQQSEE